MRYNLLLDVDSYKMTHSNFYPKGTTGIQSYFESRGADTKYGVPFKNTLFFGMQGYLKRYLSGEQVTLDKINYAESRVVKHFGRNDIFQRSKWLHIVDKHNGFLPLRIKSVEEGSVIPLQNALFTIENTDPECAWLTNYVETALVRLWYPVSVATLSREVARLFLSYLHLTGNPDLLLFKCHDFGARGVSSFESAEIGGCAHLVNFMGSDTFEANEYASEYYGEEMPGLSIPATEHSTITAWGKEGELDAFRNVLSEYPDGLVACVSDSFDIYKAVQQYWGKDLKDVILARNGTLVIRPDSGVAVQMVPLLLGMLGESFGYELNAKGYKVLNPHVRIIWGDGINYQSIAAILNKMTWAGWSADNLTVGMGGALLQKINRDTLKFALKACSAVVNGEERAIYKKPIDELWKTSKAGRLKLIIGPNGAYQTVNENQSGHDLLTTVFENGKIVRETTFSEIRNRAKVEPSELLEISVGGIKA